MTARDSRTRRPRTADTVIDLRQAAASRQPGPGAEAPPPEDIDLAGGDQPFLDAVVGLGGADLLPGLLEVGRHAGSRLQQQLVEESEASPARLDSHDAAGARVDRISVHPSWHQLCRDGTEAGLGGAPWGSHEPRAHLARAAGLLLWAQTAGSSAMALSTHHAATAAVAGTPAAGSWLPRLASPRTSAASRRGTPAPEGRSPAVAGVAVTEQGSSAPGAAPTTRARPDLGGPVAGGPTWRVSGRKWFAGNADADVLLVTAVTDDGPGTFLVPRPGGDPAGAEGSVRVERLRPGSAHRAWVVADLRLTDAWGVRLDPPGPGGDLRRPLVALEGARGLDGAVMAAACLRASVRLAGTHARHRQVPGGPLDTVPLVRTMLADLAVESEAATLLALRLAVAADAPDPAEAAFLRLAVPVAAAWLSRRAPQAALEARELLGALAWDDRSALARVHAQSSAVLAGATAHGLAVEAVRVVAGDPEAVEALLAVCAGAAGASQRLDAAVAAARDLLTAAAAEAREDPAAVHGAARLLVERLAVTLQGALVLAACPSPVAQAFLVSRLDRSGVRGLGTLPLGSAQAALVVDRALGDV